MSRIQNFYNQIDVEEAESEVILRRIVTNVKLSSTNILMIICGAIICSVGLNKDLIAFVIGAKLVAPFLNTVMCIGYGFATFDYETVRKGFYSYMGRILIIVFVSSFYFYLTPLSQPSNVMISYSSPDIYDFLVAFAGGLVGIIHITRKEQNNANVGVGIAVTLLPPLCVIGYSIAHKSMYFFFGALYLFLINSFFIIIASYLFCRCFKIESPNENNYKYNVLIHVGMWLSFIVISIPIVFYATNYSLDFLRKNTVEEKINTFVSEIEDDNTFVIDYTIDYEEHIITVNLLTDDTGDYVDEEIGHYREIKDANDLKDYKVKFTFGVDDYLRFKDKLDYVSQ
ncbi:MAG: DUF389 domain-containing protein [Lachnospirales bacterium]